MSGILFCIFASGEALNVWKLHMAYEPQELQIWHTILTGFPAMKFIGMKQLV